MKAIVYYRSRPSEPEASDLAMRLQREAVQELLGPDNVFTVLGEFIEREEDGVEAYPAYIAAVQAAITVNEDIGMINTAIIVASHAGIGSGPPFQPPDVEGSYRLLHYGLSARLMRVSPEIHLPSGGPGGLSLYAEYRPRALETLVYLCNADPDPLRDVEISAVTFSMNDYYRVPATEMPESDYGSWQKQFDEIPPGTCVLVNSLCHVLWDFVSCYRIASTDAAGEVHTFDANDLVFNVYRMAEKPDGAWVACKATDT